ncbi:hypothetical protein ACTXJG_04710 [Glutamicibacter arilaitensis]|uniref:hypothetical protein n=1 Tax=Glutamicibacter arilaitensis TaxID=256701 RepID=UPI003FD4D283
MNIQLAKKTFVDGKIVGCDIYVAPEELPDFLETIDAAKSDPEKLGLFLGRKGHGTLSAPNFLVTFKDAELGAQAAALLSETK